MKNTLFALLTALLLTGCCNKKTTIEATLAGLPDSTRVYLTATGERNPLEQRWVVAGGFTFEVKKQYPASPDFLFVQFEGVRGGIPVFIEPGTVRIEGDFQGVRMIRTSDFTVKGTPTNDLYTEFLQSDERKAVVSRAEALRGEWANAGEQGVRDSLAPLLSEQEKQRNLLRRKFIAAHPNSIASAHLCYAMIEAANGYTAAQLDSVLNLLSPELPRNSFTDELKKRRDALSQ